MGFQSLGTPNCRSCSTQDELVASRLEAEELWCSWHLRFEVRRQCGHFLWSTMHSPAFPLDGRLRAACREEYCLDRAEPTEADTAKASLHTLFEKQGGSCSSFTRAMRGTPRWGSHPITPKEPSGKESLCEKGTHQTEMSRVRPHLIDLTLGPFGCPGYVSLHRCTLWARVNRFLKAQAAAHAHEPRRLAASRLARSEIMRSPTRLDYSCYTCLNLVDSGGKW